ncbi:DUF4276 family protein [Amycolatopsis cihanbeyliensis]|nr:DUF4276 family protein [Amycolatopsis cihanbeyliensis]
MVEEPSAGKVLEILVPRIAPELRFAVREFQGKTMLMKELPRRLKGYAVRMAWEDLKVVVLVDRDEEDCLALKSQLDRYAADAGLSTPNTARRGFQVLNRIVVEELEAWYFGDVPALCRAYPRLPASLGQQSRYRDPDAISGGTWEMLEQVLRKSGYHKAGLRKLRAALDIAPHMNVESNRSRSFEVFRDGLRRLADEDRHAEKN